MLDRFFGLFSHDVAIDLGTANTLVAVRNKGIIVREPSIVVRHRKKKQVLAIGIEAKKMWGKTPQSLEVVRPLNGGVIADFDAAEEMLTRWIRFVHEPQGVIPKMPRPRVIIGIPSGVTEVERRAVQEAALSAGARKAWLIEESMAAAIGAGAPVDEPVGVFIVDIGGGTMEIAVISMSGMVVSKSFRLAGDAMDEAVISYFRNKHAMLIGPATAERIKIELGSVGKESRVRSQELRDKKSDKEKNQGTLGISEGSGRSTKVVDEEKVKRDLVTVIRGRDLKTGLPKSLKVTSNNIEEAIEPVVKQIVMEVQDAIDEIPPELMVDILERGIILAGGGSLIRGLDELMAKETNLSVNIAEDPLTCVVRGCMGLYEKPELLEKVRVTGGLR